MIVIESNQSRAIIDVSSALSFCCLCVITRNKQGLLPKDYAATEEMLAILSTTTSDKENESSGLITSLLNDKVSWFGKSINIVNYK